jgi:hypothetical protein
MMARKYLNNYRTALTAAVTEIDTTLSLGTNPPALAAGDYYRLSLAQLNADGTALKFELVDYASDGIITRGVEGTTAQAFDVGDVVQLDATAEGLAAADTSGFLTEEITRYRETIAASTTAIDRADGGIQTLTLTTDSALTWTLNEGEKIQLYLTPAGFNITDWGVTYWMTDVPTLATENMIVVEKVGGNIYAWDGGSR